MQSSFIDIGLERTAFLHVSDIVQPADAENGQPESRTDDIQMLVNEGGVHPARLVSVRHYDGTPITARFITKEIAAGMSAPRSAPINEAAK